MITTKDLLLMLTAGIFSTSAGNAKDIATQEFFHGSKPSIHEVMEHIQENPYEIIDQIREYHNLDVADSYFLTGDGKLNSKAMFFLSQLSKDTGFEKQSKFVGKTLDDAIGTTITFPHVASNNYWENLLEVMNGSGNGQTFTYEAYDSQNNLLGTVEKFIPGLGVDKSLVRDTFTNVEDNSLIKRIVVSTEENIMGKLYGSQRYRFFNGNQDSSMMIGDIQSYHRLILAHNTNTIGSDQRWWNGVALINTMDEEIDVYFEGNDGVTRQYLMNMSANGQNARVVDEWLQTFDDVIANGGHNVTGGEFVAYKKGSILNEDGSITGEKVDALVGESIFGMQEGTGFSEGYLMSGSSADGNSNNFSSSFYVPLGQLDRASGLFGNNTKWDGVAYFNIEEEDAEVTVTYFDENGDFLSETIDTLLAKERKAFVPDESLNAAYMKVRSSGNLAAVYLNGDHDWSALGGGDLASERSFSRYLRAPVLQNAAQGGVVTIINPTDEDVVYGVGL